MGNIKDKIRNRLTTKHLENELRICSNFDNNLENFNATYFAKEWIKSGNLRSDDIIQMRKSKLAAKEKITETVDSSSSNNERDDSDFEVEVIDTESEVIDPPTHRIPTVEDYDY